MGSPLGAGCLELDSRKAEPAWAAREENKKSGRQLDIKLHRKPLFYNKSMEGYGMNWKSFLLGAAVGFTAAIATKELLDPSRSTSPERVLADVKERVKKHGRIYGSWIVMKPEAYVKDELTYEVYRGGVTRILDGKRELFEFVADSKTGTILELNLLSEIKQSD